MDAQWFIEHRLVHEIHTSERKSFKGCRRRWDWIFRQNYYPKMTPHYFEFGTAYHLAMEVYYDPATWEVPRHAVVPVAVAAFVDKCKSQMAKAVEARGNVGVDPEVAEDYHLRLALGKGMLNYYFTEVAPKEDYGWKPIKVEIEFIVDIPHPETGETISCKCDQCWKKWTDFDKDHGPGLLARMKDDPVARDTWEGLPVCYAGRIDALVLDDKGNLWIIDWKTARVIPERFDFLQLDDQVGSYPWALRRLGVGNLAGFIYHIQRKGFPQPPVKNKVRRLGCIFSVNKNQDVDYDIYLKTVREEDPEAYAAGHYDEFLRYLKEEGVTYFTRRQVHKSHEELDEIERNIGLEALDMIDPNIRVYPSSGRWSCDSCAFQTPCIEMNSKSDYTYALDTLFERRQHYYIREEPSTESKGAE